MGMALPNFMRGIPADLEELRPTWSAKAQLLTIDKTLVCPVCYQPFEGNKIFQCTFGHLFCEKCSPKFEENPYDEEEIDLVMDSVPSTCKECYLMTEEVARNRKLEFLAFEDKTNLLDRLGVVTEIGHPPPPKPKHDGFCCGGPNCSKNKKGIPIEGLRYSCMECKNFNLCESCIDSGCHDVYDHAFLVIATPEMKVIADSCLDVVAKQLQDETFKGTQPPLLPAAYVADNGRRHTPYPDTGRRHAVGKSHNFFQNSCR